MNNGLLIICFCSSVLSGILVLLLTSYYCKLKDRVDDLEKQIAHISKTSAEFFCATNNRIADISTVVNTLDDNVDDLFDEVSGIKKKLDSSINLFSFCHVISEKRYFYNKERIEKLYDSPHLVFFSKRRDKNG